jgi:hypothetical protein
MGDTADEDVISICILGLGDIKVAVTVGRGRQEFEGRSA